MRPLRLVAALLCSALTACTVDGDGLGGGSRISPNLEERVDALFVGITTPGGPGCAVGVQRGAELLVARAYGLADVAANVPLTTDSVFDLASVSKQMTAATVFLLAAEGKVDLGRDIRAYVPELPDYGPTVTVNHLLQHTSGIPDYIELLYNAGFEDEAPTDDLDALRVLAAARTLDFAPGAAFSYSNSGYFLLSRVVLAATGATLGQAAGERIFGPLGMTATAFRGATTPTPAATALAYERDGRAWTLQMSEWRQTGDGGVYSTIGDLMRWATNFWTRQVGGDDLYRIMTTRVRIANGGTVEYGGGVDLESGRGGLVLSHSGSWAGYRSALIVRPRDRVAVGVLCNNGTEDAETLARSTFEIAAG